MYSQSVRDHAARLRAHGLSWSEVSRRLDVSRSALRDWSGQWRSPLDGCPQCDGAPLDPASYAALLGFYLGDGCISAAARYYALRVSCDKTLPRIVDDVEACIRAVRPHSKVFRGTAPGVVVVTANWRHWPCLFPQHGVGRKHERPIVLEPWQRRIVEDHPAAFLRGLFHSDGCRAINTTTRLVAAEPKTYHYPRWQFVNASADIRGLCTWALDLAGVAWRRSNERVISVSRREAVALLDDLIGPKA